MKRVLSNIAVLLSVIIFFGGQPLALAMINVSPHSDDDTHHPEPGPPDPKCMKECSDKLTACADAVDRDKNDPHHHGNRKCSKDYFTCIETCRR